MSAEKFISDKISGSGNYKGNISKPIVKIGILGIILGVSVMILTVCIVLGFKKAITEKITGLTTHVIVSNINLNASNEPEPIRISKDSLAILKSNFPVDRIQNVAFKNGILKTKTENEGVLLKGVDKDYDFNFLKNNIVQGRIPILSDTGVSREILISEALASRLDLKLNEKMLVYFITQHEVFDSSYNESVIKYEQRSRVFTICGIYNTSFADFDNNLSFVDIKQIRKLNYWHEEMVGNYEIFLKDFNQLEKVSEGITDFFGYDFKVTTVKENYSNIFIWLDKLDINGVIIIVLMILVAVINMVTALLILILERTNMIGLVKALGMNNFSVQKIFLHISLRLIGKGLLWGNIAGIGLCYLQYYLKLVRLDSSTYYVDHVAVDVNWTYILLLNAGTFVVCFIMLILPTFIISKLTPVKTLRFD